MKGPEKTRSDLSQELVIIIQATIDESERDM